MGLIQFVKNYQDLSTDRGYQFKFYCDKCGNGYMTEFRASVIGTAGAVLRAAGSIFGGWASSAGHSAYEVQRAVGGGAHDEALREAVDEARPHFHQCPRCGQWVCHHPCWNGPAALCTGCAPEFQGEVAAAHAEAKAQAARRQLHEKAQSTDYVGGVSMAPDAVYAAPRTLGQGPPAPGYGPAQPAPAFAAPPPGRALPSPPPGAPAAAAPGARCAGCGAGIGGAKFCPECGTPARPLVIPCAACGHRPERPTKFCAECGVKMG